MRITDALLGEHGVFYSQFDHLEKSSSSEASLSELLAQAALLEAGLAVHAQLEEELLFQTLEPIIGGGGPLAVMRMEHQQIEDTLSELPHIGSVDEARGKLLSLVQVAREHFAKEEQILFKMAEGSLDDGDLNLLGDAWGERRKVSL